MLALAERERDSRRLGREAANLRVALDTLLACAPVDAMRLCVALWPFWLRRIDLEEGHRRFMDSLAAAPERTPLRAEAHEGLAIAREHGHAESEWRALHFLGASAIAGDAPARWGAN